MSDDDTARSVSPPSPAVALADEFVQYRLATEHERALWIGTLEHLERWDDLSEDGRSARVAELNRFGDHADSIEPTDDTDRLLLETIAYSARAERDRLQWREELKWVNHAAGIVPSIFTFLPRFPLVTVDDGERYLAKVAALAGFIDEWRARLIAATAEERVTIAHLVDRLVETIDRHLSAPLSSGSLGTQEPPAAEPRLDEWRAQLQCTLDEPVAAAFARLRATLRDVVRPAARSDDQPGLCHIEGGSDLYERLVWANTTLDLSAGDVHEIGLAQVAELEAEYVERAGPLFDTEDVGEIYRRLRDDASLRYRDAGSLVADATKALAKAAGVMHRWFARLPKAECVAVAVEQGSLAFYSPPSPTGSKPGTFFFNTADPTMWATYQLEAVTYHESIPGHHLQMAIAQETAGLHRLLGRYFVTAYGEGWGLYTERLADEMGLYSSELDRVGMLAADSMRACRLVVDTGMHALGWSRDRAIAYMIEHSPLSSTQVINEIDRYIGTPGQALSYMIGRLEIERIRADAETRLGDRFDIRGFHDVVLGSGSITLPSLRRIVEAW